MRARRKSVSQRQTRKYYSNKIGRVPLRFNKWAKEMDARWKNYVDEKERQKEQTKSRRVKSQPFIHVLYKLQTVNKWSDTTLSKFNPAFGLNLTDSLFLSSKEE